jgi:hypothetical protein
MDKRVKKWSGKVRTKWHPPAGFFEQGPAEIADGLEEAHDSCRSAMSSINFYVNRAGKNLSASDRKRLAAAKLILQRRCSVGR